MPTVFRPCIDLHEGVVKQIVGGSLSDDNPSGLTTNFVASQSPAQFAELYRKHDLSGHVIKLGNGSDEAAKEALTAWPGGLHIGGGITIDNALKWLQAGAEKVIVTSFLFPSGRFPLERLQAICVKVGRERLVVDVSCRRRGHRWFVAMNTWQDITDMEVNADSLSLLSKYCSEFLIHAADVEGLCNGIDEELVQNLGKWAPIPTTYAGGAKGITDLDLVDRLSGGRIDLTFGSALDIFGGSFVKLENLVRHNVGASQK